MLPHLGGESFGNPASVHSAGRAARAALERARARVAAAVGAAREEIRFTSGGTEANNLAILGLARARESAGRHVLATPIEHASVLEPLRYLRDGAAFEIEFLSVDADGGVDPRDVASRLRPDTAFVAIGLANNEIGTVQPVAAAAAACRAHGVPLHTDAVQALGKMPLDLRGLGADTAALSAHKSGGPTGIGAIYVRAGLVIPPLLHGGGQEDGLRPGTPPLPAAVGFGAAAELAAKELDARCRAFTALARRIRDGVDRISPAPACWNGPRDDGARLPNTLNFVIPGVDGEALRINLDLERVSVSAGSACASGSIQPSHVLLAVGLEPAAARAALRVSLGARTQEDEIDRFLDALARALSTARGTVKRS